MKKFSYILLLKCLFLSYTSLLAGGSSHLKSTGSARHLVQVLEDFNPFSTNLELAPMSCPTQTINASALSTVTVTRATDPTLTADDCTSHTGRDHIIQVNIPCAGSWTFTTCGGSTNFDTYLYLGTSCCDVSLGINDDFCGLQSSITITTTGAQTVFARIEGFAGLTGTYTLSVSKAAGTPQTYGSNTWNVNVYNGNFSTYVGYYSNSTTSEFNMGAHGMSPVLNPSVIAGYQGCSPASNDNWSAVALRQGFPCNRYDVQIQGHDDNFQVIIDANGDGTNDFTSTNYGCCNTGNGIIWTGILDANSRVELRMVEGGGDAYFDVNFNAIGYTALQGGTISGTITNGMSFCPGNDPGNFGTSGAAAQGTVPHTNGGSYTYDWEASTTSGASGFTSLAVATQTYDPGSLTQTTWFRRRVSDKCGNIAYSNVIQVVANSLPAIASATASASPICANTTTTLTANGVAGTGATVTWWTGAGGTGTNLGTGNSITAGPGTYYARVTGTCTPAAEASVTVGSLAIPAITSVTATSNQICASATTTLTANGVAGAGAVVTWWTGAGGTGTNLGTGSSINAGPGTYYARVTGTCGPAVEANTIVQVAIPDYTYLSSPTSTTVENCSTFTVMGMINEVGITGVGQGPGIDAEFGYSNANTDPSTWTTWSAATFHSNTPFGDDRYSFNFTPPGTGTYYYTFRYRLNGCDWTIAGTPGGSAGWNGTTNNSGSVSVTPYDFTFTNLQFPATATIDACSNMTAYGRVNEPGLTVGATANPLLLVEFGYNNANTDPSTWTNWSSATFNTQTGFGDHEYRADFTTTVPGTYYYTFRYRHATCSSDWQYGGYNGGTWNGTTNVNGQVTVNAIIDWANLQWPPDATVCVGNSFDAYGLISEPFVTDGPGQGAGVSVEFGYNSADTDPSTWTTWAAASYNPLYSGSINNDEYMYSFTAPSTGTYYYTFRYRMNPLCQWQYGGYNFGGGGFWNGTTNVNGTLTVIDASSNITLASSSVSSVGQCDDGPWTYYKDNNDNFVFAVNWAPDGSISAANAAAKAASSADISVGPMTSVTTTSYGTWVMGRYWNVNAPAFDEAVDVRFYFDPAEKTAVENAMTSFTSASNNVIDEGFVWFKTVSGAYTPALVNYNGVDPYNTIELTGSEGDENGVHYVEFAGLASFSGGSGATGVGKGNALPVELMYFTGTKAADHNLLNWATATEDNAAFYDIQRSKDGINFQTIGRVDAVGNALYTNTYNYKDEQPLGGISYYRLKMVDTDESTAYSNIISLERAIKGTELVQLFPNPTQSLLNYELETQDATEVTVKIMDNYGRILHNELVQLGKGRSMQSLDVSQLANGLYYIQISCCDGDVITQKFVKD